MSDSTERNCDKCIHHTSGNYDSWYCKMQTVEDVKKEAAEEYNGGWIACGERLPDDFMSMEYLTTVKGHFYPEINYYCVVNHKWFSSRKTTKEVDVIAWQPLPESYKECD